MALGASRVQVISLFMKEAVVLGLFGVTIGLIASLVFARAAASLLFGITRTTRRRICAPLCC